MARTWEDSFRCPLKTLTPLAHTWLCYLAPYSSWSFRGAAFGCRPSGKRYFPDVTDIRCGITFSLRPLNRPHGCMKSIPVFHFRICGP
ncbi:hypothetical protein BDR07DRAFT_1440182 [Suillus spraguei]|nr:hypothetical protein BDR07DRAFT_1440182 [Suillus spraguei]